MRYNWQQKDWPNFRYNIEDLHEKLLIIANKIGFLSGKNSELSSELQNEFLINRMVEEAIKTSEIEGDFINRLDVRSSIKMKLGLHKDGEKIQDKRAIGIAELMFDVRNTFQDPLSEESLCKWHLLLSRSMSPWILIGRWRIDKEPMQVISVQSSGKRVVHFEAPPADRVPEEMKQFIHWFNHSLFDQSQITHQTPIRSAIAHLYFESIHPFDDGNGRIGRAIAEKALAQGYGHPLLLSLSSAIDADKKQYYSALKEASKSNEITAWIQYFIDLVIKAEQDAEKTINFIIKKAKYFDKFSEKINVRQMKIIKRMLDEGGQGVEGGMSAKKYMKMTGVSKATATRDLQELLGMQAFNQSGSGRNVRYELNL